LSEVPKLICDAPDPEQFRAEGHRLIDPIAEMGPAAVPIELDLRGPCSA